MIVKPPACPIRMALASTERLPVRTLDPRPRLDRARRPPASAPPSAPETRAMTKSPRSNFALFALSACTEGARERN